MPVYSCVPDKLNQVMISTMPSSSRTHSRISCKRFTSVALLTLLIVLVARHSVTVRVESSQSQAESILESTKPCVAEKARPKYVCAVGNPPWNHLAMREELNKFHSVYTKRPGGKNEGGGAFFHYFALWCVIKALKPSVIVESGIYHGVGSWFLRQAAGRDTQMIFISPEEPKVYRDEQPSSLYFTSENFIDFGKVEWSQVLPSGQTRLETLVFFDDHQDGTKRVQEARQFGFGHVMFDDNYLPGFGDNLSVKMICEPAIHKLILGTDAPYKRIDNFGSVQAIVNAEWYLDRRAQLYENIDVYAEFPPVWSGPSRFKVPGDILPLVTLPPIFPREELTLHVNFDEESKRYTHIVYLKLKPPATTTSQAER